MMIAHLYDDAEGHSRFGEIEIKQKGTPFRISSANQDVAYWQMSVSQPGFSSDWHATGESKIMAIFSGQIEITVSNGERRYFSRGDMLFAQDMKGQGHLSRVVGTQPCVMLHIGMPGGFKDPA